MASAASDPSSEIALDTPFAQTAADNDDSATLFSNQSGDSAAPPAAAASFHNAPQLQTSISKGIPSPDALLQGCTSAGLTTAASLSALSPFAQLSAAPVSSGTTDSGELLSAKLDGMSGKPTSTEPFLPVTTPPLPGNSLLNSSAALETVQESSMEGPLGQALPGPAVGVARAAAPPSESAQFNNLQTYGDPWDSKATATRVLSQPLTYQALQAAALQALQGPAAAAGAAPLGARSSAQRLQLSAIPFNHVDAPPHMSPFQTQQQQQQQQLNFWGSATAAPLSPGLPPRYFSPPGPRSASSRYRSSDESQRSPLSRVSRDTTHRGSQETTRSSSDPPLQQGHLSPPNPGQYSHLQTLLLPFPAARYSNSIDSVIYPEELAALRERARQAQEGTEILHAAVSDTSTLSQLQLAAQRLPQVRALLGVGGRFVPSPSQGQSHYEGGKVRLVNLPKGGKFAELVAVLAKTDASQLARRTRSAAAPSSKNPGGISSGTLESVSTWPMAASVECALKLALQAKSAGLAVSSCRIGCCTVRYLLPSDPSVMVDVVDDDDVQMMFEELAEVQEIDAARGIKPQKLKIFVQWEVPPVKEDNPSSTEVDFLTPGYSMVLDLSASGSESGTSSSVIRGDTSSASYSAQHAAHRSAAELKLSEIRTDRLEVISAADVTITEYLGTGMFGDMYYGQWRDNPVAVKCMSATALGLKYTSRSAWLDFVDEANSSMGRLRHPNLVEVYGIVLPGAEAPEASSSALAAPQTQSAELPRTIGPRRTSWDFNLAQLHRDSMPATRIQRLPGPLACPPALVMEHVSGRSLKNAIERGEEMVAGRLARLVYALDISRAMAYLHSKGVVSFDLKSGNVMLGWRDMRPTAKVAGYVLAAQKAVMSNYTPGVTMSPSVFPWTAPEVLNRPDQVSRKADVYAFAIIMYEMWALGRPYDPEALPTLMHDAMNYNKTVRPVVPPPRGEPEPGPGWAQLMQRCWEEDPQQRPEFADIANELYAMAKNVRDTQRGVAAAAGAGTSSGTNAGAAADVTVTTAPESPKKQQKERKEEHGGEEKKKGGAEGEATSASSTSAENVAA